MSDDMALVSEFARNGSEQAFATLVARHINLVYSISLREVHDPHLAQEVTQAVFIILAQKATSLSSKTILCGWLCRTARNVAGNALKVQRRRRYREQQAYMESQLSQNEPDNWVQIQPMLEPAMAQLGQKDHDAVVLRFFQGRSFKDVSLALGTSEAGAKMRVNRALEKLRKIFSKRGLTVSTAVIAGAVSANAVQAAPIGLATCVTVAATKGTVVTTSTITLIKTTLKIMAWAKLKTSVLVGSAALLAIGSATLILHGVEAPTNTSKNSVQATQFPFAGYDTPEAGFRSFLYALSTGEVEKVLDAMTPEQKERFKKKLEGKSEGDIRREFINWANSMASFKLDENESISDDEARLHLVVQPYPGHAHVGHDVQVMQRIGNEWKYAGKYGVDIKEK